MSTQMGGARARAHFESARACVLVATHSCPLFEPLADFDAVARRLEHSILIPSQVDAISSQLEYISISSQLDSKSVPSTRDVRFGCARYGFSTHLLVRHEPRESCGAGAQVFSGDVAQAGPRVVHVSDGERLVECSLVRIVAPRSIGLHRAIMLA